jgi:hypothetical protein
MHDTHKVEVDHASKKLIVGLREGRALSAARVSDQDIYRAGLCSGGRYRGAALGIVGNIGKDVVSGRPVSYRSLKRVF